jgi:hypothetical protein
MLCLVDDSPETLACAFIAHRLASGLEIALTLAAPSSTAWSRARTRRAPLSALASAGLPIGDESVIAVTLPWSGHGPTLRRLVTGLRCPLVTIAPNGARRLRDGVAVHQRVVVCVAGPHDAPATQRVAAGAAHAMHDRLLVMDPSAFCRDPVAIGRQVELVVISTNAARRRAMRRALQATGTPLLLVPSGGEHTWQLHWLRAPAPLALVR